MMFTRRARPVPSRQQARPPSSKVATGGRRVAGSGSVDGLSGHKLYLLYNLYKTTMIATKRLAVTESVWADLSDLKRPGETFSQLLEDMIEREKKARLVAHLKTIADEGDFVELPP
jgi:predicted CopG family antitoxin